MQTFHRNYILDDKSSPYYLLSEMKLDEVLAIDFQIWAPW